MTKDKPGKPSVATYGDYEMITPPNRLRMAISQVSGNQAHDDPIARAEEALAQLSSEFTAWMDEECNRLDRARCDVRSKGFTKATRESLFHVAHDIKGEAATFGYPWVAATADSLCRLIEHTPDVTRIPLTLIDQHVDTVRAIIREKERTDIAQIANLLTKRLREVTDEFLAHENRDRPEVIAGILSPSLAPADSAF